MPTWFLCIAVNNLKDQFLLNTQSELIREYNKSVDFMATCIKINQWAINSLERKSNHLTTLVNPKILTVTSSNKSNKTSQQKSTMMINL